MRETSHPYKCGVRSSATSLTRAGGGQRLEIDDIPAPGLAVLSMLLPYATTATLSCLAPMPLAPAVGLSGAAPASVHGEHYWRSAPKAVDRLICF
jgi:hypothetical protein